MWGGVWGGVRSLDNRTPPSVGSRASSSETQPGKDRREGMPTLIIRLAKAPAFTRFVCFTSHYVELLRVPLRDSSRTYTSVMPLFEQRK